jgi:hypothetical protein
LYPELQEAEIEGTKRQRYALTIRITGFKFNNLLSSQARVGHSLHCGLNAPPTASQASVTGVANETQTMRTHDLKHKALPLAASHRRTALERQRENRFARFAN